MGFEQLLSVTTIQVLLLAALIGAVLEIDNYFVGMTIVSQPVIAGIITGAVIGDVKTGLLIGAVVQLLWINTPPVGAFVPPSATAITITAAVFSVIGMKVMNIPPGNSFIMFSITIGAGIGYFVGQMDIWNRKLNTGIIHKFEKKVKSGKGNYIILIQIFAVFSKIIRDFVLYSALFFLGIVLAAEIFMSMPIQIHNAFGLAFWMLPAVGFAVVFDMFKTGAGIKLYAVVFLFSYILFSIQNVNIYFFALALAVIALIVIYNSIWNRKEA